MNNSEIAPTARLQIGVIELLHARPLTTLQLVEILGADADVLSAALHELAGHGYVIAPDADGALRLIARPDRMIDTEILAGLRTKIFAKGLHCYAKVRSTNTRAVELADSGAPEGTIVVAEEQTGGKGRLGRQWFSASGLGIWSSIILRPSGLLQRASGLSLLAALAFAQTVEQKLNLTVGLKWPNDGLIDGKKVLGVLTEVSALKRRPSIENDLVEYAVCGTGINVSHTAEDFPDEFRARAISLAMAQGRPVDRMALYRAFLEHFDALYTRFRSDGIPPFLAEYKRRSVLLGQEVAIKQGHHTITGTAVDLDDNGALIVRNGQQDTVVFSGEATLRA